MNDAWDDTWNADAEAVKETDKALLCMLEGEEEVWVPKSVIHDDSEVYSMKANTGRLMVKGWWARKMGLV
jgi:hypothetical protein